MEDGGRHTRKDSLARFLNNFPCLRFTLAAPASARGALGAGRKR
jgi:hypothetical protein